MIIIDSGAVNYQNRMWLPTLTDRDQLWVTWERVALRSARPVTPMPPPVRPSAQGGKACGVHAFQHSLFGIPSRRESLSMCASSASVSPSEPPFAYGWKPGDRGCLGFPDQRGLDDGFVRVVEVEETRLLVDDDQRHVWVPRERVGKAEDFGWIHDPGYFGARDEG